MNSNQLSLYIRHVNSHIIEPDACGQLLMLNDTEQKHKEYYIL